MDATLTLYDRVGGMPFFERLVGRFYDGIATDPVVRPLYPEADLAGARHRLTLFLAQYWGGPRTYDLERGHPRLRMRHFPFAIGPEQRDRWLFHMREAIEACETATRRRRGARTVLRERRRSDAEPGLTVRTGAGRGVSGGARRVDLRQPQEEGEIERGGRGRRGNRGGGSACLA